MHPSLPQTSGLLHLPQTPLCTQTDTQTSRTHTLTHLHPTRAVPPTAAFAATPPQGMPGGSHGHPRLPSSPKTPLQGCWGELVRQHKHPPLATPIFSLEKALEGLTFFLFFFFLNQKKTPKIIIFLIVSPNINGGTCSSDNTLKEQYRTHCLQRGNVQARGTRTRGAERGQQHTRFTLRRKAGGWHPPGLWRD